MSASWPHDVDVLDGVELTDRGGDLGHRPRTLDRHLPHVEDHPGPAGRGVDQDVVAGLGLAPAHESHPAGQEGQGAFAPGVEQSLGGQHPAQLIPEFMQRSQQQPAAMVLGKPVFDADAPRLRVNGRKVSNFWANLETLWNGIGDSLYGFRVYPIAPLVRTMQGQRWMRRFDFDPEAVVRLSWNGVPAVNIDAPVRYFQASEGGVSHFKYLRDNTLLTWMHTRLFLGFVVRLPVLVWRKLMR